MKTVIIAEDPFNPASWEKHEVTDLIAFLIERFVQWPATARIYHEKVAQDHDVTPHDELTTCQLERLNGTFYVVVYPGDPVTIIIAVVAVAAAVAAAFLLRPSVPDVRTEGSPNNQMGDRQNGARIAGRIPDIFGTVRSTPDLLTVPYKLYVNNEEVEISYMCVGRGQIDCSDIRDGTTLISDIAGASAEVYFPNTSPNNQGSNPWIRIGTAISRPVYKSKAFTAVTGVDIRPDIDAAYWGNNDIYFTAGTINMKNDSAHANKDFTSYFAAGDPLFLNNVIQFSGSDYVRRVGIMPHIDTSHNGTGALLYGEFVFPNNDSPVVVAGDTIHVRDISIAYSSWTEGGGEYGSTQYFNNVSFDGDYVVSSRTVSSITFNIPAGTLTDNWTALATTYMWWDNQNQNWWFSGPWYTDVSGWQIQGHVTKAGPLYDLTGTYTVLSVSAKTIVLSNPSAVNSYWNVIPTLNIGGVTGVGSTPWHSAWLTHSGPRWSGSYAVDADAGSTILVNLLAAQGLYRVDNDGNQQRVDLWFDVGATRVDANNNVLAAEFITSGMISGSAQSRSKRAVTIQVAIPTTGRYLIRVHRTTAKITSSQVVDMVQWVGLYGLTPVSNAHFGNITTIYLATFNTATAQAVKERKLNCLATGRVPPRLSGSTFSSSPMPTKRADDIISQICRDPFLGNRQTSEVDYDNIYSTVAAIISYFGTAKAAEFSYTFDQDNQSFEEMMATVASAIFCVSFRRGNIIKLQFEQSSTTSSLLFNHRNKIPGSETRTVRFGNLDNNDGVEIGYVDPADEAKVSYQIPTDGSAVNPKKIDFAGVRSRLQAYFHAWRTYNKILYQNVTTKFTATQEADVLVIQDRILVADDTRPDTQAGYIVAVNALELTTSQDVVFAVGQTYNIFLQHVDGTTESIGITAGSTARKVILGRAPRLALVTDLDMYAQTTYVVVAASSTRESAFLLAEKNPNDNFTSDVTAVNYDSRYYAKDLDYKNGIVADPPP